MNKRVAIIGIGQTTFETEKPNQVLDEIVFEAARNALDNAGLQVDQIDNITIAAGDQVDGRPISSMLLACPAGAYLKDEIKVTEEGSYAAILAMMRILSGIFEISLVVSWSKPSESFLTQISGYSAEPFYSRPAGLNYITAEALMLNRYDHCYGLSSEAAAKVIRKNRKNGQKNHTAYRRKPVYSKEVFNSAMISRPIRAMDIAPTCDGACALVLASEKKAVELCDNPVWINGVGWASESYYFNERGKPHLTSLKKASQNAYKMASITNPLEELDVAEIYDLFSYRELMAYEALGFCEIGQSKNLIEREITDMDGKLPVNPSGGLLCGNPFFAAGLIRLAEAARQVRGAAGAHQITGVRTALAQGSHGFCGQGNSVFILGK